MKKLASVLMTVALMVLVAHTASAVPPLCCGTDGSCDEIACSVCPPDKVCDTDPPSGCGLAICGCRLGNGDCIMANQACVDVFECTPDWTCLMAPPTDGEQEKTWCDADDPEEEDDTPRSDKDDVDAETDE